MTHQITLPTSAFLGNFEKFTGINTFPSDQSNITLKPQNTHFISLHPLISAMLNSIDHNISSPYLASAHTIQSSDELDTYFDETLSQLNLSDQDQLLAKYILSELTRNTLEHSRDPRGSTIALSYGKKSNTLRLGVSDHGIGIKSTVEDSSSDFTDYDAIIHALTPGVTGTTFTPGGTSENAGAGLFFVKSLAHQLGSHFLLYSGTGLFKLLKRKTVRSILKPDSSHDHASGGNGYPLYPGTAVGIDIPLDTLLDFAAALTQIRSKFYSAIQNIPTLPSTRAKFI
ncbi:sensor histidine kinase [Candidatus Woesebacteria bacterium]|nr:sensor histidine kinase [Candidatus Woesebacteria bacterium]